MRLTIFFVWVSFFGFNTLQLTAQDFITQWSFANGATQIRFNALTEGPVNYTWVASPSNNSGSGSFTMNTPGSVTLSSLNIPAGNVVTLSMAPDNLRRFYIDNGLDRNSITDVIQWGSVTWASMERTFRGCENLIIAASDIPNLTNVSSMLRMFEGATLFNQDIGNWNTFNVTDMGGMFWNATSFNQDITNWNTSNVTYMASMFRNSTSFNQDIGIWNISNVTNLNSMFSSATSFNQDLSSWNTANVTNLNLVFFNASSFNQNIGGWTINPISTLDFIFNMSGMDCDHYSATLVGWEANNPTVNGRSLGAHGREYGTSAVAARNALINNQGWTITGDSPSGTACNSLLPIDLLSFTATQKNKNIILDWATASELNNHFFEIEHSKDGIRYYSIGEIPGHGTTSELKYYEYIHDRPSAGINYYRIKQVDYDGKYTFSDIQSVLVQRDGNDVSIYPNPVTSIINVIGTEGVNYSLYDLVGRQIKNGQISNDVIEIDHLPKGMYYLHLDNDPGKSVHKIWKE